MNALQLLGASMLCGALLSQGTAAEQVLTAWENGTSAPSSAGLAGLNVTLNRRASTTDTVGSDDGSYGSFGTGASTAGASFKLQNSLRLTLTLVNNTAGALHLDALRFDFVRRFEGSPKDLLVTYDSGDLGVGPITLFQTNNVAQTVIDSGDYPDYDVLLSGTLADTELAPGETAVFSILADDASAGGKSMLDNLALTGSGVASPPRAPFLSWTAGAGTPDVSTSSVSAVVSVAGSGGVNSAQGSTDGSYGSSVGSAPDVGGSFELFDGDSLAISITNYAAGIVRIDELNLDFNRRLTGSPTDVSVAYEPGDLDDGTTTLGSLSGQGVVESDLADYADLDCELRRYLADITLDQSESAVFRVRVSGASERAAAPAGGVFADFEGKTYGAWKAEGKAFGTGPAKGTLPKQMRVFGMRGRGMVNSFLGQDRSTGSLTSPEFTIENDYITFLIGGGQHRNTALELLVDGRPVRHATGRNSESLRVEAFDVRQLKDKTARLRIVDHNTGGWGHILVDQITFTNTRGTGKARKPAVALDTGLAPEVTDLNAADVSYAKEKEIEYLGKPYISTAPADLKDGIPVGKLGVDGGNRELVLAFAKELAGYTDDQHLTDSLLVSYKGKLLFESYYRRGRQNYPHYQMSITKSYTALALGRAIQLGHFSMDGLHKPVVDFLKEVDRSKIAKGAERITLDNAMHMGSGIRLDGQKVKALKKNPSQLKGQGQVRAYLENTAPIPEKDIAFKYQASDPALAMQVVDAVVPGSAEAFIRTELLGKVGITNYGWQEDLSGLPKSAAGCSMRSRDMLKIGMMLMAGGKWQGKQLIPEAFVKRALSPLAHSYGTSHYGYFWWVDDFKVGDRTYRCPAGRGAGGQFILMFPELELIVVITAHNKGMGTMLQDAPQRIIPAFAETSAPVTPVDDLLFPNSDYDTFDTSLDVGYDQSLRPQFHFTSRKNWLNDPNGMVYYDGEWHMLFQHVAISIALSVPSHVRMVFPVPASRILIGLP